MTKVDTVDKINGLGFFKNNMKILDVGCGPANWVEHIAGFGYKINYTGIDINENIVNAARFKIGHVGNKFKNFTGSVHKLDVYSSVYNHEGKNDASSVHFPVEDNSIDLVICHSLFTHLGLESVAKRYMDEINRVGKIGSNLWITFFQSPPNDISHGYIRTVYNRSFIDNILSNYKIILIENGTTLDFHDQLEVACERVHQNI